MKLEVNKAYARRGETLGPVLCIAGFADRGRYYWHCVDIHGEQTTHYADGRVDLESALSTSYDAIAELGIVEAVEKATGLSSIRDYQALAGVLQDAHDHAANGKGHDRHGSDGKPFENQPSMEIARMVGTGYPIGQAMKKCAEASRMETNGKPDAAIAELLGAINYLAIAKLTIDDTRGK